MVHYLVEVLPLSSVQTDLTLLDLREKARLDSASEGCVKFESWEVTSGVRGLRAH